MQKAERIQPGAKAQYFYSILITKTSTLKVVKLSDLKAIYFQIFKEDNYARPNSENLE